MLNQYFDIHPLASLASAQEEIQMLSHANAALTRQVQNSTREVEYLRHLLSVNAERVSLLSCGKPEQLEFALKYENMERKLQRALSQQRSMTAATKDEQVQILLDNNQKLEAIIQDRGHYSINLYQEYVRCHEVLRNDSHQKQGQRFKILNLSTDVHLDLSYSRSREAHGASDPNATAESQYISAPTNANTQVRKLLAGFRGIKSHSNSS